MNFELKKQLRTETDYDINRYTGEILVIEALNSQGPCDAKRLELLKLRRQAAFVQHDLLDLGIDYRRITNA